MSLTDILKTINCDELVAKRLKEKLMFSNSIKYLDDNELSFVLQLKSRINEFSRNDYLVKDFSISSKSKNNLFYKKGDNLFKEKNGMNHLKNFFSTELQFIVITLTQDNVTDKNCNFCLNLNISFKPELFE